VPLPHRPRCRRQPGGELGFEGAAFLAEDVPARVERAVHRRVDCRLVRAIPGAGIGLRNDDADIGGFLFARYTGVVWFDPGDRSRRVREWIPGRAGDDASEGGSQIIRQRAGTNRSCAGCHLPATLRRPPVAARNAESSACSCRCRSVVDPPETPAPSNARVARQRHHRSPTPATSRGAPRD